ncbi:hypothetical protein Syun_006963 [Stephania yunnanensis]|uniref:Uncharacterized protein n=1 Tax=Stephania yunnanensis TaxID=152371 RepID=A0AAP0KZB4_9MAGN
MRAFSSSNCHMLTPNSASTSFLQYGSATCPCSNTLPQLLLGCLGMRRSTHSQFLARVCASSLQPSCPPCWSV